MTEYEQLRAALDKKLAADPALRAIVKRVQNGTATFKDTAEYAKVLSHILGRELSAAVLNLSDRESIVSKLLRDCYDDINSVCAEVQKTNDEAMGLHLKPQKANYPAERVQQFSHSLIDPTVKDSVIKRRARAGSETITKSFHDDFIKKNAQFRTDVGLKCYIIRIGTKCCDWCTEVAGKYEMGDQPDGIFRRHDNCDCTIIYDGQVLRGKQNANGSRSKTWEELPNVNAADYVPPTLSEAEGRAIEQRNLAQIRGLKINNSSIDNSSGNGIIKLSINLFDPKDPIYLDALSIEEEPGFEDIHLHGSPSAVQVTRNGKKINLNVDEFIKELNNKGYTGSDLRLCSCSTAKGDNSFAQQLSQKLRIKVKAPDDDLYYIPEDGVLFVGSEYTNTGSWRIFENGVEIFE